MKSDGYLAKDAQAKRGGTGYRKAGDILHRREDDQTHLLFVPRRRSYVFVSKEIFDIWNDIENLDKIVEERNLSADTVRVILDRFLRDNLIESDAISR